MADWHSNQPKELERSVGVQDHGWVELGLGPHSGCVVLKTGKQFRPTACCRNVLVPTQLTQLFSVTS